MAVFVGRTSELERLNRRLELALQGKGGVVFITGDAGAGKSTLTERFLVDAALNHPEARVISGDCSEQYGSGDPYQPFVEAFRDLVGGAGEAGVRSLGELAKRLAPHWIQAIPVAGDIIAATMATASELKESMGGVSAAVAAPSEEALFFQYTELLLAAAEEEPIILRLDDLHWADHATVSLLGHVGRKIADKPVLILGTYRGADVEVADHPIKKAKLELERYKVAEEVALTPLKSSDLGELIEGELGGPPTPELLAWLERRAGSNPLFFSELLKWLVEHGIATEHHGEWTLAEVPEEIEIPRSAESAIEKRLERLEEELYKLLEYASIEGDEFSAIVLARTLEVDELELEERIEPLIKTHQLIRHRETLDLPDGDITDIYQFTHSLIQSVLHKSVRGKRKILLHRRVAEILSEIYAKDPELIAHKLALHFDEGRVADRAFEFSLQAAERAVRLYAHWDALELLGRALRNAGEDDAKKVEVLYRLGEQHRLTGHYSNARQRFDEALGVAGALGDRERTLLLKRKAIWVERDRGQTSAEELITQLRELTEEARELGAKEELCEILWTCSFPLHDIGIGGDDSVGIAREALAITRELGREDLIARANYELGHVLMFGDDPAKGIPPLMEALDYYNEAGDKDRIGRCRNCIGGVYLFCGDYKAAAEELDAAAAAFDEIGHPTSEGSARNNLGMLLTRIGDWDAAEENLKEAERLFRRTDATVQLLHPLQNMAELFQAKGDLEATRERWAQLRETAKETGYWNPESVALCGLGTIKLESGDLAGAKADLQAAKSLMREEEKEWTESQEAYRLLAARISAADGDAAKAIAILEEAEKILASRDRFIWATFRLEHGKMLSGEDKAAAASIIEEARAAFEELGAAAMQARAADLLSR